MYFILCSLLMFLTVCKPFPLPGCYTVPQHEREATSDLLLPQKLP